MNGASREERTLTLDELLLECTPDTTTVEANVRSWMTSGHLFHRQHQQHADGIDNRNNVTHFPAILSVVESGRPQLRRRFVGTLCSIILSESPVIERSAYSKFLSVATNQQHLPPFTSSPSSTFNTNSSSVGIREEDVMRVTHLAHTPQPKEIDRPLFVTFVVHNTADFRVEDGANVAVTDGVWQLAFAALLMGSPPLAFAGSVLPPATEAAYTLHNVVELQSICAEHSLPLLSLTNQLPSPQAGREVLTTEFWPPVRHDTFGAGALLSAPNVLAMSAIFTAWCTSKSTPSAAPSRLPATQPQPHQLQQRPQMPNTPDQREDVFTVLARDIQEHYFTRSTPPELVASLASMDTFLTSLGTIAPLAPQSFSDVVMGFRKNYESGNAQRVHASMLACLRFWAGILKAGTTIRQGNGIGGPGSNGLAFVTQASSSATAAAPNRPDEREDVFTVLARDIQQNYFTRSTPPELVASLASMDTFIESLGNFAPLAPQSFSDVVAGFRKNYESGSAQRVHASMLACLRFWAGILKAGTTIRQGNGIGGPGSNGPAEVAETLRKRARLESSGDLRWGRPPGGFEDTNGSRGGYYL